MRFKLFVISLLVGHCATFTPTPVIQTDYGRLSGENVNDIYYAYRSVPYAKSPVGDLRFEPPAALDTAWYEVLNATRKSPKCMHWSTLSPENPVVGSEDCLFVNVFVPVHGENKQLAEAKSLPVMVFIHGGGFMWGSADFYGEEYIMQHGGLILVTVSYRLGALGFMSTESEEIAGNMGLKDQSMALKFIYDNIHFFGGDKEKILLTGWSAGGASVNYHMITKATDEKWFKAAISFSGTALCPCHAIYPGEAEKKSKLMAERVDCPTDEIKTAAGIKKCLQSKKAEDIVGKVPTFYKFSNHPFAIFGPVIEPENRPGSFLTDYERSLMVKGETKSKPWLISRTTEDGAFGTAEFLRKDENGRELIYTLNDRWLELAPVMFFFNVTWNQEEQERFALELKKKYFGDRSIGVDTYRQLEDIYNWELANNHIKELVETYVKYTKDAKAYGYIYDNPAPYGLGNHLAHRDDWKFGTLHGDDVFLIFKTHLRENHPYTKEEKEIAKNLINLLIEMAETGVPSYDGKNLRELNESNNYEFNIITKDGMK